MDLDQQLQQLVDQAPQDGVTAQLVAAIAPVLRQVASQLHHLTYYLLESADGQWVTTTLSHRQRPELEKTVIYVFSTPENAQASATSYQMPGLSVRAIPVIALLFQSVALVEAIDSLIVFEEPTVDAIELAVGELNRLIQEQLSVYQQRTVPPELLSPMPPWPPHDLA